MKKNSKTKIAKTVPKESAYCRARHWDKDEWDRFHQFRERMEAEAAKVFGTDEEGESIVEVTLRNRAYHERSRWHNLVHDNLLVSDEEWNRQIRMATLNVSSSADDLDTLVNIWEMKQTWKRGMERLMDEANRLCLSMGISGGCVVTEGYGDRSWPRVTDGCKWYPVRADLWRTEACDFDPPHAAHSKDIKPVIEFIRSNVTTMEYNNGHKPIRLLLSLASGHLRTYGEYSTSDVPVPSQSTKEKK